MADAQAAARLLARIKCGKGSRPGLLNLPVASAISADGVILILEAGNNRIGAWTWAPTRCATSRSRRRRTA